MNPQLAMSIFFAYIASFFCETPGFRRKNIVPTQTAKILTSNDRFVSLHLTCLFVT